MRKYDVKNMKLSNLYKILKFIKENPEVSVVELSAGTQASYSAVWWWTIGLREMGILKIERTGRKKRILLTEKGNNLLELLKGFEEGD